MGRPRDARTDRAILEATLELIAELGVYEFRTEDVAARAGVGKGAIYRRYDSKDALVTAAIAALVGEAIAVPDTGSTREDLLVLMREAVHLYSGSLAALSEVLRRGITRGDLSPDADLELVLDVLGGPLFYRLLVTGGPIDEQLAEGVADLILRGFSTESPRAKKSTTKARRDTQR
jgi:AcrR family transcriptional regulator